MREVKVTLILSTDHYGYLSNMQPPEAPGWRLSTYVTEMGSGKEYGNNVALSGHTLSFNNSLDYILERAMAELKQAIRSEGVTLAQKEAKELVEVKAELAKAKEEATSLKKIKDAIATIKYEI
jgi:hypothetical protein